MERRESKVFIFWFFFFKFICVSICLCLHILTEGGAGLFCLQASAGYCQSL